MSPHWYVARSAAGLTKDTMGTQKVTDKQIDEAMRRLKSVGLTAKFLGLNPRALHERVRRIERDYGISYERVKSVESGMEMREHLARVGSPSAPRLPRDEQLDRDFRAAVSKKPAVGPAAIAPIDPVALDESVRQQIGKGPRAITALAERLQVDPAAITASLSRLSAGHVNVYVRDGVASIEAQIPHAHNDELHTYVSDEGGHYKFGIISDNHMGSRHCRLDVNDDLYDWFAAEKVDRVYNCGNWIEGEARFNKFDLTHVGMAQQVGFFAERYPKRDGITTYFVAGDDHEGWYQQREGINIGSYAEHVARTQYNRTDLRYLGYVEAYIKLQHRNAPASAQMLVQHPGGGSAYAISYAAQKAVESVQGGEKPAVWLFGHWHKIFAFNIRNVICIGAGCTKDLDTFGRKLKLSYHIGGTILELWQDDQGAISRWRVEHKQYFDRGYRSGQYDHVGTAEAV